MAGDRGDNRAAMADVPAILGVCDPAFVAVREALADNFRTHGELGAAVAVVVDGVPVVDLWAGWMDEARSRAWERDTLVDVFSVGKAIAATALLMLAERGRIDVEAPVARYWPEFAQAGKDGVTVRMLLAHTAGLPGIRPPLPDHAMYDWPLMTAALAAETPWWQPGAQVGYHVNTFGFLIGELVRRASGMSVGTFVAREIAGPLGADFHFGIGPADDARIADYVFSAELFTAEPPAIVQDDEARRELFRAVYSNPRGISGMGTVDTREWRAAEMPSTNGHANARALARIYAALAAGGSLDGVRLLSPGTLARASAAAASGPDAVLGRPSCFGLGFQLSRPERPLGRGLRTFGHFGAGGSVGFADPDARLAFGYTMNRSGPRWQNPRNRALIDAAYARL
jgi:CubicO group peptidase (beta-lactamase class C family)